MQVMMKYPVPASLALVGLLSACAPNPYVMQDRVYGGAMYPPPVYTPPPESYRPPAVPYPTMPTMSQTPVARTIPLPDERPPAVEALKPSLPALAAPEMPPADPAPVPEVEAAKPPVHYPSSAAVKSLVKQADAEAAQGKAASAASTLERALRIESDNPDLWMKLSALYERQGNHQQAVSMADKAAYYRESLH